MKNFLLAVLLVSTSTVFAQVSTEPTIVEPTASLGSVMKAMSSALRKIAAQVSDANQNAASEQLALDFVKNVEASKAFTPKTIRDLPADQQDAKKQEYIKMLDDTAQLGKDLASAFHNNDNKLATDILAKLSTSKKEGHAEFK